MRFSILALSLLAAAGVAYADDDPMASRFGNTTIATDRDGTQTKIYYRADHTLTAVSGFWASKGQWEIKDGQLCLTYENTRPKVGTRECVSADAHKVGDKWKHNGKSVTLIEGVH